MRKVSFPKAIGLFLLLFVIVAGSYLLVHLSVKDVLNQEQQIKHLLFSTGYASPLIFTVFVALFTAIGIPRLLFCTLAGFIFGFSWGFVWSHLGTLLGAYLTFVFARWSGRDFVEHKLPKIAALSNSNQAQGWQSVLIMRQLPISGLYNDILLGLSKVSHSDFWIGSFLGFIPLGVTATLVGAGVLQMNLHEVAKYLGLTTCAFLLLSFSLKMFVNQLQRKKLLLNQEM